MIDDHINRTYGKGSVAYSHLEANNTVYCAVLRDPEVTTRFLSDPFTMFDDKSPKEWFRPGKPDYLFNHNSNGLQASSSRSEPVQQSDPLMRHQVSTLSANVQTLAEDLRASRSDVRELSNTISTNQNRSDERFANMMFLNSFQTNLLIAQNQLSGTDSCIAAAHISLSTATEPVARTTIEAYITQLKDTQSQQKRVVSDLTKQVLNQQSIIMNLSGQIMPSIRPPPPPGLLPPPSSIVPLPSTIPPPAPPSLNRKHGRNEDSAEDQNQSKAQRPRIESQPELDDVDNRQEEMAVDKELNTPQVSILPYSSHAFPFNFAFPKVSASTFGLQGFLYYFTSLFSLFLSLPFFTSLRHAPQNFLHYRLNFITLLYLFTLMPLSFASPTPFHTLALNANGMGDVMKISAIQQMVRTSSPHALVFGETKSTNRVSQRLQLTGYNIFESPGRPSGHRSGKWGVMVGIHRSLTVARQVSLPSELDARVLALDVVIPTLEHTGFTHRLIGVYAPWDPGEDPDHFWRCLTDLCTSSPHSWSIHGDFNVSLTSSESISVSSHPHSAPRSAYRAFLANTLGIDLWSLIPDRHYETHYTFKTSAAGSHQSFRAVR
ncbi:hypothetical protein H0H92_009142 [Tricholoma furcatifolium]|nr:hypothetical protein H0H92_009142 [Tricholoma furcatifolium]